MIDCKNPKDGSDIVKFKGASEADVDKAVDISRKAFETGPWATFTGDQRGQCLNKFAQLLEDHASEFAYLESVCSGRPLGQCTYEVPLVAKAYRCMPRSLNSGENSSC